jgi:pimeloyl-ACP methyl ester carboxylesterase
MGDTRLRKWYEHLASSRMLVRFDRRGMGRSQRGVQDYSRDARTFDLEAVAANVRVERLDLLAFHGHVQAAIAFAARHPKTVTRLLLWGADLSGTSLGNVQSRERLLALAESDWDFATESIAHSELGWKKWRKSHARPRDRFPQSRTPLAR